MLSAEYEQEQAELEGILASDLAELDVFTSDADRAQQFLALARKYTDFTELTTLMINEFVDRIIVHAPEKINGERTMQIDIYLKFIGKFDVPLPEPTPEELALMDAQAKRRAKERARYVNITGKVDASDAQLTYNIYQARPISRILYEFRFYEWWYYMGCGYYGWQCPV